MIIGCPGAGKSTFARALGGKLGLPVIHMDRLYWNADGTSVDEETLERRVAGAIKQTEWIIDGNYRRTLELRMRACDTIFFLDLPVGQCIESIIARVGTKRDDLPWVESGPDEEFLGYVRAFPHEQLGEIYCLLEKYGDKNITVFKSRAEVDQYLASLE